MTVEEFYRVGAFSVRKTSKHKSATYGVYFDHGAEGDERTEGRAALVPPAAPSVTGGPWVKHPAHVGQESAYQGGYGFRTKTGARRYMLALHAANILPVDRPATLEEIRNVAAWIREEASA